MSAPSEHASLSIDGTPYEVVALEGHEAISELFRYEITCVPSRGSHPGPRALAGAPAAVTLSDGFGASRTITGIVAEAEERSFDDGGGLLHVVVRPRAFLLTLGRSLRVFNDASVVDIVSKVLAGAGVAARWDVTAKYAPHVYCAEYREDDWTFVSRLLEEEGIYAWFDHEGDESVLVLADDARAAPDLTGEPVIPFAYEMGMTRASESILELGSGGEVVPTKFTVASFSPANPRLEVRGGAGSGSLEIYSAGGGGTESPDECARQASFLAQAAASRGSTSRGRATSVRLVPGRVVTVAGHPSMRLDGRHLVVESRCSVTQRRREADGADGEDRAYGCSFRLVPGAAGFRSERRAPPAKQAGLQLGVVVGQAGAEVAPDETGRVRVQHYWDREGARDEKAGKWMRVAQRGTADSMLLPRVGWTVSTLNDEGEIDAPSVLSRLHDGEHPPTYPLPANKTRVVFRTATTPGGGSFNEIHFEDKKGAERMFWNASKDLEMLVQNDDTEQVVNDARRTVGNDDFSDIAANYAGTIERDQSVAIAADETITVSGSSDKTVRVDETSTIGGKRSVTTGTGHATNVTEKRTLKVGTAQIDATLGYISASAKMVSILVGGALVRVTAGALSDAAGWASVQTIGGAKLELVKKSRTTKVKRRYIETVGAAMILNSGAAFGDAAELTSTWTVGGVLSGEAPKVRLEAKDKLSLKVGSTSLVMTPDEIEISAATFDLSSSSSVVVESPKVTHN